MRFLALVFTFLAGCGSPFSRINPETTALTIGTARPAGITPQAVLTGKLMVYAVSVDGQYQRGFMLETETATRTIQVPNGRYRFFGIGWEGPGPGEGATRCAEILNPVELNGSPTNISLVYSGSGCQHTTDSGSFGPLSFMNSSTTNFRTIGIKVCSDLPPTSIDASVNSHSWRLLIEGYEKIGTNYKRIQEDSIPTTCQSLSAGIGNFFSRFPVGILDTAPMHFLAASAEIYNDGSCGNLVRRYSFPDGLRKNTAMPTSDYTNVQTSAADQAYIYVKRDF